MNKDEYLKLANEKLEGNPKQIMLDQINKFYDLSNVFKAENKYKIGDDVYLTKGTFLHGTYKNYDGLVEIVKNGIISSWFTNGRLSKYPSSVGIWNLKKDYYLKDYINFYSGGTILYSGVLVDGKETSTSDIIPYDEMFNIMKYISHLTCHKWDLEQTKEARFLPSLVQEKVQIGIILNGHNKISEELLKGDILGDTISDEDLKPFVNEYYYDKFLVDKKQKDDFFTDRESAILFGVPSSLIEGILVGREYENDPEILKKIKELLPNAYICNLDGKVIF